MSGAHRRGMSENPLLDDLQHRKAYWWIPVVILGLLAPTEAYAQLDSSIDGTYFFVGGNVQRQAHQKVLEAAVHELSPILRPVGRGVLKRYLEIPRFIAFNTHGDFLDIAVDPYPPRRSKLDGIPTSLDTVSDDPSTITRSVKGLVITERIITGKNRRAITYRFHEDNERLTLGWHVTIPRYFSQPIRYKLSYRRR